MYNLTKEEIGKISEYIFVKTDIEPADLCLVFGTRQFELFSKEIKRLYDQNLFKRVLISGGNNRIDGLNEAMNIKDGLLKLGLSEDIILTENKANNTLENVIFSREIIKNVLGWENIKSILAVGKSHAARRILMTMKKNLPKNIKKMIYTINIFDIPIDRWHEDERFCDKVIGEYNRIPIYMKKGNIEEIKIDNGRVI